MCMFQTPDVEIWGFEVIVRCNIYVYWHYLHLMRSYKRVLFLFVFIFCKSDVFPKNFREVVMVKVH